MTSLTKCRSQGGSLVMFIALTMLSLATEASFGAGLPPKVDVVRQISYRNSDLSIPVRRVHGTTALFYQSKMSCDVDGSPNAYHSIDDALSLDTIDSAYGQRVNNLPAGPLTVQPSPDVVVYVNGAPYIQTDGDYKGFFLSETSLRNTDLPMTDPNAYLDARKIQYIVLADGFFPEATVGDLAAVYDPVSKKYAFAVFGDIGPSSESGEASLATLQRLGLPATDGKFSPAETRTDMFYLVFPGSNALLKKAEKWPYHQATIDRLSNRLFRKWGGTKKIEAILKNPSPIGKVG